jgi:hypothetical protein
LACALLNPVRKGPVSGNWEMLRMVLKSHHSLVQVKGTNVSDQDSRLQGHRVSTSGRPYLPLHSGVQRGRQGQTWVKGLTFSDAFANAWAERSCSNPCSNTADFADVRACSLWSKSLVALRIRSLTNGGEHTAQDWGSRGRRFKSCHPDGKQQVRGRFGQNPRRPLCCRVATGVAMAHILTSPFAAESRWTAERAVGGDRCETIRSGTPATKHVRG